MKKKKIYIWKILEIYGWSFFPTNDVSPLECCHLYINGKYKTSCCCKIEAVIQRCSVKMVFLKTLQNSQKNLCTIVSFLIKLQLKKRLWRRCFPVNIARFLRRPILIKHLWWLPLVKLESYLWNQKNFSSSYFCVHLISYVPSTLWRNSCKTPYPQKNVCGGVHSFSNSNLKTFKLR